MIKAQELRIGNIISSQSNLHKQVTVLQLFSDSYQADFGNGNRGAMMYSTSDGIPLTSEWLERFGFQLSNELKFWFVDDGNYMHVNVDQNDNGFFEEMFGVKISYVHQLQNWWFIVTGSELKLKY